MKKLTRKNLDALAAVMPVLSETEQQVCMGGVLPTPSASPSSSLRRITDGCTSPMCQGCCRVRLSMLTMTIT